MHFEHDERREMRPLKFLVSWLKCILHERKIFFVTNKVWQMSPITHRTLPLVSTLAHRHRNSFQPTKSWVRKLNPKNFRDQSPWEVTTFAIQSPPPPPPHLPSSHVLVLGSHRHNNQPLSSVKAQQTKFVSFDRIVSGKPISGVEFDIHSWFRMFTCGFK